MNYLQPKTKKFRTHSMRAFLPLSLLAVIAIVGCGSASQRVVGTWKGDIAASIKTDKKDDSLAQSFANGVKGFISSFVGPLTFEFNDKGRYKMTMNVGSQEGTYTVSGNEVKVDSDDGKNHSIFIMSDDGKSMTSKKDFKSDDVFTLKKQD